jgi:tRNA threonylcarbamoyladenosine biosynthesis protein TsaB
MALILNIETATQMCSVALAKDGEVLFSKEKNGEYSHAENLTVFIEEVMQHTGYSLSAIDAVAVSKGPGSYTGLRIGVSVAKGLCYALDKPLVAIETLKQMAKGIADVQQQDVLYCPMIDARRMEVYCALYDKQQNVISPTEAKIMDAHSFENDLAKQVILFFGDGAIKCKQVLAHQPNAHFLENIFPSAVVMASLSEQAFQQKQLEDVAYFVPYYLKDFVSTADLKK